MALWTQTPRAVVDATMDVDSLIAPRVSSSIDIRDKVFHLKTQIESVEDAPGHSSNTTGGAQLVIENAGPQDAAQQKHAAEMQMWWDEAIVRNMDLPEGYEKVAVLLVKWDDELDDLKTRAEVRISASRVGSSSDQLRSARNSRHSCAIASIMSPRQSSSTSHPSRSNRCALT